MYQTVNENNTFELVEKKSRFIANLMYVESKLDAETKIKELKKKYHDARHNCFAFRVLEDDSVYEKSSDDGEPSGTAGAPMLNILQKNNLCNVLVVVTRYFGGILLGTGGLVRAYSGAASGVVDSCDKICIELGSELEVKVDYSKLQSFQYYCKKMNIRIVEASYGELVSCRVEMENGVREMFWDDIGNKRVDVLDVGEIGVKYIRV